MAIFDWNGTTKIKNKKIVDWDGTVRRNIKKIYDWDGTTRRLVYSAWNGEIYNRGNIYEELTGGWIKKNGYQIASSQIIYNSDNMVFQTRQNNGQNAKVIYSTVNNIDVTNYTKMKAIVDANIPSWSRGTLLKVGDKQAYGWDKAYDGAQGENKTNWTIETDISSLTGSYPIEFIHDTTPSTPMTKIYKIWME